MPAKVETKTNRSASNSTAEVFTPSLLTGLIALLIITVVVYAPALRAGFIWDDNDMLFENHLILAKDGLRRIWFGAEFVDYFPLTMSSLWIEWRLWALNATGYHVTNLLLHLGSAFLLWRILVRINVPGAWWAALLFAVHPVNVESVAWITERKNTLSFFLLAVSVVFYLRFDAAGETARSGKPSARKLYFLSLAAFALSLLAKTSGVMLPFVLLGLTWWQRQRATDIQLVEGKRASHFRQENEAPPGKRDLLRVLPFFAVALALALLTIWFQYHKAITETVVNTNTFAQRLAGAGWAVWFYLGKALFPLNLTFVYPRWQIDAQNAVNYLPGVAVLIILGALWWWRNRFGRGPFLAFGYFVVMLFPVLGFFNIYFQRYSFVADHWQYVSIIGILALLTGTLSAWLKYKASFVLAVISAACAFLAWKQTHIYQNQETLWRDTLKKNPRCWMAQGNWGLHLFKQGRIPEAIAHYRAGLELKPDDEGNLYNLGVALLQSGQADEAVKNFESTLRINPDHKLALSSLAYIRSIDPNPALRNGEEAVRLARRAAELSKEQDEWILDTLAVAYSVTGQFEAAIKAQNQAIALAAAKNQPELAREMEQRLQLYQSGQPFRAGP